MKRHGNLLFGEKGLVHGCYVFPSIRTDSRPMSENTINAALGGLLGRFAHGWQRGAV